MRAEELEQLLVRGGAHASVYSVTFSSAGHTETNDLNPPEIGRLSCFVTFGLLGLHLGQSGYTVRRILLGIIKDLLLRLLCHTD